MSRKMCPNGHGYYAESVDLCVECGRPLREAEVARVVAQRYRLDRIIGHGGTRSTVWEGVDLRTTRPVAVKILPAPAGVELMRFMRGAFIAAEIDHPNVARVYEYGEYGEGDEVGEGGLYLVMERLTGATLDRVLRRGALPWPRAVSIAEQLLCALCVLHGNRGVHRDIKPSNIFVTPDEIDDSWRARLFDFDLAIRVEDVTTAELYGDELRIVPNRMVCGTPAYMAPEQIVGYPLDGRADLYAVAVTLYRMLTGRLPFSAEDRQELYRSHIEDAPPPPVAPPGRPELPPGLVSIVLRALSKRRSDRFKSAREMRMALRVLADHAADACPSPHRRATGG
ncbi:MAG: serine/threonine protein kinase [Deltaproteobacteria bacterium]|nr:MAG: serine/threonine protein kinase [Deltaproteobacteria bacterium]